MLFSLLHHNCFSLGIYQLMQRFSEYNTLTCCYPQLNILAGFITALSHVGNLKYSTKNYTADRKLNLKFWKAANHLYELEVRF